MGGVKGNVIWERKTVLSKELIFLFCFGEKCMSGKVNGNRKFDYLNEYEIDFIRPDYFANELITVDNKLIIREVYKISGNGKIT